MIVRAFVFVADVDGQALEARLGAGVLDLGLHPDGVAASRGDFHGAVAVEVRRA
jgi:hypothetical protein